MRRDDPDKLYDADITPGIRDDKVPMDDEHAPNVGAFADGGSAVPAHDPVDLESGVMGGGNRAEITGIGAGNIHASKEEADPWSADATS